LGLCGFAAQPEGLRGIIEEEAAGLPQGHHTAAALEARLARLLDAATPVYRGPRRPLALYGERLVIDLSWLARMSPPDARLAEKVLLARLQSEAYAAPRRALTLLVLEEAEELLAADVPGASRSLTMLASHMMHYRKLGIALVIVAHSPSLIPQQVRKNVANVAVFRLNDPEDAMHASAAVDLQYQRQLAAVVQSLRRGECVVRPASINTWLRVQVEPPPGAGRGDAASMLLESLYTHPELTLSERRAYLRLDSRSFKAAVEELLRRGLASLVTVYQGRGRPAKLLQPRGMNPGIAHRYLEHRVRTVAEETLGLTPDTPGDADLALELPDGRKIAVEIETGSNINAGKYLGLLERGYDMVVIVPASRQAGAMARRAVARCCPGKAAVAYVAGLPRLLKELKGGG